MLKISGVHAGYGRTEVIHGVDIEVPTDGVVAVIETNRLLPSQRSIGASSLTTLATSPAASAFACAAAAGVSRLR